MSRAGSMFLLFALGCPATDDMRTTVADASTAMTAGSESPSSGSGSGSETASPTTGSDAPATAETAPLPGACEDDSECRLHSDCCTCDALPAGDTPEACDLECERTLCEEWGITEILCSHTCLVRLVECDANLVMCADPMPECDEGFAPSIEERCWTRHCVPVELCTPS